MQRRQLHFIKTSARFNGFGGQVYRLYGWFGGASQVITETRACCWATEPFWFQLLTPCRQPGCHSFAAIYRDLRTPQGRRNCHCSDARCVSLGVWRCGLHARSVEPAHSHIASHTGRARARGRAHVAAASACLRRHVAASSAQCSQEKCGFYIAAGSAAAIFVRAGLEWSVINCFAASFSECKFIF